MTGPMVQTTAYDNEHDHPDTEPCPECDLSALDDLECDAVGIAKRAEVVAAFAPQLAERRAKFDQARDEYATKRATAATTVDEIRGQLDYLMEQLKCMLPDDDESCLDQAYEEVWNKLIECRGPSAIGCCIDDDCEFASEVSEDTTAEQLRAWIAEIEGRAERVEACFDALVDEPTALTARVNALKAEVDQLVATLGGQQSSDVKKKYTEALIAQQKLANIWFGFDDVGEFIDCICQGLTCSFKGRQALAVLHAELAVRECRETKAKDRCAWLEAHLIDEILATYEKLCTPQESGREEPASQQPTAE